MRSLVLPLAVLLAAPALGDDAPSPFFLLTGAAAGALYDSNITRTASPEGDLALDATAHAGGGWAVSDTWGLSAVALYRGRAWVSAIDFSTHVTSVMGLVTWSPAEWVTLGLAPSGGYTFAVDSARAGPRVDGRAYSVFQPLDWLAVRVGYGYLWRGAAEPVFASCTHEAHARLQFAPLAWLHVTLSASLALGNDVVYRVAEAEVPVIASGRGPGAHQSAAGPTLEVIGVDARTSTAAAELEILLPAGFSLVAELAWVTSDNPVQPWQSWMPSALVAWDLP